MTNLNLTNYHKEINDGNLTTSFRTLNTLYTLADNALAKLASQYDDTAKAVDLEKSFLRDKNTLLTLAAKVRCKNIHEISRKVDFLNRVHLDEKRPDDFSLTDILLKSIWQDCQIYL